MTSIYARYRWGPHRHQSDRDERARIAGMSSRPNRPPDDPDMVEAPPRMRTGFWIERIEKLVAEAPPLTNEQREYIAGLLRSGGGSS